MTFALRPWQLLLAILAGLIGRLRQEVVEYKRGEADPPLRGLEQGVE